MNRIKVDVKKNSIIFSIYNREIKEENMNDTNIIDTKNLKFSEQYILDNLELVSSFFNIIILKEKINTAIIKNLDISETVLKIINYIQNITKVIFVEDKELNYTISSYLLNNKNLIKIECYSMPEIMLQKFSKDIVDTRCEILFISDFMQYNNINTYSKLCNKDKIIIDSYITKFDYDDIIYFIKTNTNLKKITIKGYKKENLITLLEMLKQNNLKKITIILLEDEKIVDNLLNDAKLFPKLSKKYNVIIKIKYSKKYKEKNKFKELFIVTIKTCLLVVLISLIILFIIIKINEIKEVKKTSANLEFINDIVDSTDSYDAEVNNEIPDKNTKKNNYKSPYYTKYEQIYDKLYEKNNDTVGWISIKNTNVDYPVVQGKDNEYYLKHSFDKSSNGAGWVFVDYRNDLSNLNNNTIIYAHNVTKGELMFGSLKKLLDDQWNTNESNLVMNFDIKGVTIKWKIFSIYVIDNTNDYLITKFNDKARYNEFIEKIKERSIKDFNTEVTDNDKILTLSTCYDGSKKRLVVHAKKI